MRNRTKDGLIFGGVLGASLAYPQVGAYLRDFLADIIPATWQIMGNFSIPFYIIIASIAIGWVVDKT